MQHSNQPRNAHHHHFPPPIFAANGPNLASPRVQSPVGGANRHHVIDESRPRVASALGHRAASVAPGSPPQPDAFRFSGEFVEGFDGQWMPMSPYRGMSPSPCFTPRPGSPWSDASLSAVGPGIEEQFSSEARLFPSQAYGTPRQHRAPSPNGDRTSLLAHERTTSYGYPYYPVLLNDEGELTGQFLGELGLHEGDRRPTSPITPQDGSSIQGTISPHQLWQWDAPSSPTPKEESQYPTNAAVDLTTRSKSRCSGRKPHSSSTKGSAKGRSVTPSLSPGVLQSNFLATPTNKVGDNWHVVTAPSPITPSSAGSASTTDSRVNDRTPRRKNIFQQAYTPRSDKDKARGEWIDLDKPREEFRKLWLESPPDIKCSNPLTANADRYSSFGWVLAKVRLFKAPPQGKARYAWCIAQVHEEIDDQFLFLSGPWAGHVRTIRKFDRCPYSPQEAESLVAKGNEVITKIALSPEEIAKKSSLIAVTIASSSGSG